MRTEKKMGIWVGFGTQNYFMDINLSFKHNPKPKLILFLSSHERFFKAYFINIITKIFSINY